VVLISDQPRVVAWYDEVAALRHDKTLGVLEALTANALRGRWFLAGAACAARRKVCPYA
jgi:hypothetical protein